MNDSILRFPPGFLWGAGTSAHQVEGGNRWNDWWRFEHQPGAICGGDVSGEACRHYDLFDSDFALARADGHNAHRLSIEWSRIEPERGRFEAAAVAHYHDVFASLKRHALTPVATLHHFTLPLWVADHGGWESPETIDAFCAFARFCAREYGGEVDWWCTVNEPEVYAFRSYSEGLWPPRKRDDSAALCVIANLLEAHGRAYRIVHAEDTADADGDGRAAIVGFAKHMVQLEPARWWLPLDALRAQVEDRVFNAAVSRAAVSGDIALSIPGVRGVRRHVPELEGALDYFGLNYYTRWQVKATGPEAHVARAGSPANDLGWEVWPDGLGLAVARADAVGRAVACARLPAGATNSASQGPGGVPVLVTEHGFADSRDAFRPQALIDSLVALGRTIERGANVCGYLHWSMLDNFEWVEGYRGRFGLYAVDFTDPARPRRRLRSAEAFARIAKANAIELATASEG